LKTKNACPDRFLGKEDELKDYIGVKLYVDVSDLVSFKAPQVEEIDFDLGFDTKFKEPKSRDTAFSFQNELQHFGGSKIGSRTNSFLHSNKNLPPLSISNYSFGG
jgi:hypothetical protein